MTFFWKTKEYFVYFLVNETLSDITENGYSKYKSVFVSVCVYVSSIKFNTKQTKNKQKSGNPIAMTLLQTYIFTSVGHAYIKM